MPPYEGGRERRRLLSTPDETLHMALYLHWFVISVACILAVAAVLYVPHGLRRPAPTSPPARGESGRGRPFAFQVVLSTSAQSQSRSLLRACVVRARARCARLARPQGGERACNTALSDRPTAGEGRKQSSFTEKRKGCFSCLATAAAAANGRRTDGPPCTTATRNSSRRAFRGVRSSFLPSFLLPSLSLSVYLPIAIQLPSGCRDGSAKGRPGCRNGQSRRRRRGSLGGNAAAGPAEWSAGVVALLTSCMVSCRYVVVFA